MKTFKEFRDTQIEKLLSEEVENPFRIIDTVLLIAIFILVCPIAGSAIYTMSLTAETISKSQLNTILIAILLCVCGIVGCVLKLLYDKSIIQGISEARLLGLVQEKQKENFKTETDFNIKYSETIDDIQKKVHMLSKVNQSQDVNKQSKLDALINDLEETYVNNADVIEEYTGNKFIDSIIFKVKKDHPGIDLTWRGKAPADISLTEYELSSIFYVPLNLSFKSAKEDGCNSLITELRFSGTTMYILIVQKNSFDSEKWVERVDGVPVIMSYNDQYELRILYSVLKKKFAFFSVYSKDGKGYCEIIVPSSCSSVQAPYTE